VVADPAGFVAQPTLSLSACPTYVESGIAPRHIDCGVRVVRTEVVIVPAAHAGRAARGLAGGELVAGRRYKDTWVLED